MRNSMLRASALVAALCALPVAASAAASGSYICAIGEVYECLGVTGCKRVSTDTINLSEFIVVDVDKKMLTGASMNETPQTEDIEGVSSNDKNIFLYGTQDQETWNATISLENGALTGGISSGPSSFALFGNCTQK
ncbi:hypothetical protein [Methyloceanibacter sp.]|jgi:hypothetical protein|uniref:hypothetical protein n=1 Tax=Methyloceanibacter sp. TaxID=1965321 RepID=UPI003D6D0FFA